MSLRRLYGLCAVLVLLAGVVLCRPHWGGQPTAYAARAGRVFRRWPCRAPGAISMTARAAG